MEIENTLTGTEENVDQFSGMYESERGPEQARENNIILKAITLNSPQFRHESIALTLTGGKKEKEKGKKTHNDKRTNEWQTTHLCSREEFADATLT